MPLDLIEELRLRRWARENYVPARERNDAWEAVIHDEMHRRDLEEELRAKAQQGAPMLPEGHRLDRNAASAAGKPHIGLLPATAGELAVSQEMHYF